MVYYYLDIDKKILVRRIRLQEDCQKPKWSVMFKFLFFKFIMEQIDLKEEKNVIMISFFKNFSQKNLIQLVLR